MIDILQLPGWRVSAMGQEGTHLVIEATYTQADEACHKCGSIGVLYKHGTKVVRFRDIPVRMMPTVIDGTVQRYRCRDCGETFVQTPDGIDDTRRMTERCVEFIKQQCIPHTFTHIAEQIEELKEAVAAYAEQLETRDAYRTVQAIIRQQAEQIKVAREAILMLMHLCEMCNVPDGPVLDFAKEALAKLGD